MSVGGWLGPFVAFGAGVVSFFSPCVLPLVPVYLAQMAGATATASGSRPRRAMLLHASCFVGGFGLIFAALGASVGLIGFTLLDHEPLLLRIAGVMVIVFGMHLTGILRISWLYRTKLVTLRDAKRAGYARSALVGGAFALGWTPCVGPVLTSILVLAAASSSALHGAVLLGFYAAGLGIPFLAAAGAAGSVAQVSKWIGPRLVLIERAAGVVLIIMGALLFTNALTQVNQLAASFGLGGI